MKPDESGPEDLIQLDHVKAREVAAQPGGSLLAIAYYETRPGIENAVLLWDTQRQQQVRTLRGLTGQIRGIAFSPDGKSLACAGHRRAGFMDGEGKLWDAETGECRWTVEFERGRLGSLRSVAFSPDGAWVAVGSACNGGGFEKICLLNAEDGREVRAFAVVHPEVCSLAVSPDGRSLVGGISPNVAAWDPTTGEARWSRRAHASSDIPLTFAPDGRRLASCGDRTVVIWDAATGEPALFLKGHQSDVRTLAFSSDGQLLATGGYDGLRVWDIQTGEQRFALKVDRLAPVWIAFGPNGVSLTAVDSTLRILTWDLTKVRRAEPRAASKRPGPVGEERGLLAAILETPDGDAVRLVYSDWLEEHGDPDRAEFIRLQCELAPLRDARKLPAPKKGRMTALTKREEQLLAAHREAWLEGLAPILALIDEAEFRRGFLWKVGLTGVGVKDEHLAALRAAPEVEELVLDDSSVTDAGMVHLRALTNLRHLTLTGTAVTLAGLTPLRELKRLVLVYNGDWGNEPNPELEDFKAARNEHFLRLPAPERRAEALRAVRILAETVEMEGPDSVQTLSFSQSWTTDADLVYLRELPELESLSFYEDTGVTTAGLEHLRGLKNLKCLDLCRTGVIDVEPLRYLEGLEELLLSSLPSLQPDSLRHLQPLKRLRKLNLFNGEFDDAIMPHLGRLHSLEELELAENRITDAGLEQLSGLRNLRRLDVDYKERRKDLLRRLPEMKYLDQAPDPGPSRSGRRSTSCTGSSRA